MLFWTAALSSRSFCARSLTAALAVALLLAMLGQSQAADPEPKRVLMLQSFGLRFKPCTDFAEYLRPEMIKQSKVPIDFQDLSLLSARLDATRRHHLSNTYKHCMGKSLLTSLSPSVRQPPSSCSGIALNFFPKLP